MSLKTEIDKTNELKNKTKKAKTNIDNKLVELGGQNANNLADVPNKMQSMIVQYKKIASGQMQTDEWDNRFDNIRPLKLNLNLSFTPDKVILYVIDKRNNSVVAAADSKINTDRSSSFKVHGMSSLDGIWIKNLNSKTIDVYAGWTDSVSIANTIIKWIAIG